MSEQALAGLEKRIAALERTTSGIPLRQVAGGGGGDRLIHAADYAALALITSKPQGTRGMTDNNGYIYVYRRTPGTEDEPFWRIDGVFEQDDEPSEIGERDGDFWYETSETPAEREGHMRVNEAWVSITHYLEP